jgi:hypothetical protein
MIFGNNRDLIEKAKLMNLRPTMKNSWYITAQEKVKKLAEQNLQSDSKCLTCGNAEKILEYHHAKKVDMIILKRSNKLRGISKIKALGSVTRKVSEFADCPVLIILPTVRRLISNPSVSKIY